MNYRKFKKNAKALSPVVASIILIAVTVAVSVVVAAWMGGMTIGLMGSAEQVSITNIAFIPNSGADVIQVLVQNTGGTSATISSAFVNGVAVPNTSWASNPNTTPAYTLVKSSQMTLNLTLSAGYLQSGASYTVKLITAKGTSVVNTATYNP